MKFFSLKFLLCLCCLIAAMSCSKTNLQPDDELFSEKEMLPATLNFSGYNWLIKNSGNNIWGPGANYFSKKATVVFVDGNGDLHLKIIKKQGKWLCSEVSTQNNLGYGKYVFVTKGNVENYDRKMVVGLFTWDDNDYQTQANSELDVEFSKWGSPNAQYVMEYSVQPNYGPQFFPERTIIPNTFLIYGGNGYTTHTIDWNATRVKFETHTGDDTTAATRTHQWIFDNTNPPRQSWDGYNFSDPIVVPAPGTATKAHINFWLFDQNGNGVGDVPSNGMGAELVVHRFQYIPQ